MKFYVITLFSNLFPGDLGCSVIGKALDAKLWDLEIVDMRRFAQDAHKTVDDVQYGGGPGMVIRPDVLGAAVEYVLEKAPHVNLYITSPRGEMFDQICANEFASSSCDICIICGRYNGVDQRVMDYFKIKEISIGNYVLSGGEYAAKVIIDATIRLIPDVLGNDESIECDTFAHGSMDHFQHSLYTRPSMWKNMMVPETLRNGNHKKIKNWRNNSSAIAHRKVL